MPAEIARQSWGLRCSQPLRWSVLAVGMGSVLGCAAEVVVPPDEPVETDVVANRGKYLLSAHLCGEAAGYRVSKWAEPCTVVEDLDLEITAEFGGDGVLGTAELEGRLTGEDSPFSVTVTRDRTSDLYVRNQLGAVVSIYRGAARSRLPALIHGAVGLKPSSDPCLSAQGTVIGALFDRVAHRDWSYIEDAPADFGRANTRAESSAGGLDVARDHEAAHVLAAAKACSMGELLPHHEARRLELRDRGVKVVAVEELIGAIELSLYQRAVATIYQLFDRGTISADGWDPHLTIVPDHRFEIAETSPPERLVRIDAQATEEEIVEFLTLSIVRR